MDNHFLDKLRSITSAIRASAGPEHAGGAARPLPFVTISRQGGAGGHSLANRLVERLNAVDPGDVPWTCWDKELTEKIANDHRLSKPLIDSLGEQSHSWLADFFTGLPFGDGPEHADEFKLYRRVASTIRALVQSGRVVIVGRGGAHITSDLPGGVHVRLVAPFPSRVARLAALQHIALDEAASRVRQLDRNREQFHKRYFPGKGSTADFYTISLNTAQVDEDHAVECILPLIHNGVHSSVGHAA